MINTKQNETEEAINTLQYGITLPDKYTIHPIPSKKNGVTYIFKDPQGDETDNFPNKVEPLSLTQLSAVGKEINDHINPGGRLAKEAVKDDFKLIKMELHEYCELYRITQENNEKQLTHEKEAHVQLKLDEAFQLLQSIDLPLLYIGSLISWKTAGERNNILLTFLAFCSQIILKTPISVIGLGEGSTGKTHIMETVLGKPHEPEKGLIPNDFIRQEKSVTEPAMYNQAKENPFFYDGKIVYYGDLGGDNTQEDILKAKNLIKELQSDGYANKPLSVVVDGDWTTRDLTLLGNPCLAYTTVPGFKFDDQEMSRSIFVTARTDNRASFQHRKNILELKGKTFEKMRYYERDTELVKYMVLLLRERMEKITIINPYMNVIIDFLSDSEYFKRDIDKYNNILLTITAFNSFNQEPYDLNGKKVIFTSLKDLQLFMSLLKPYHESINVNISPKAAEVLNDIRANMDEWIELGKINDNGITVNEYYELIDSHLHKRSIGRYFSELNNAGFLKVVDNIGKANVYDLTQKVSSDPSNSIPGLSMYQKNMIRNEIGHAALDFICEDSIREGLSIDLQDPNVEKPPWDDEDD